MPEEEKELKFPLTWSKCPNCGSTRRIAGEIIEQERKKGRIGEGVTAVSFVAPPIMIADPRKIILASPMLMTFYDVCADCGTLYCVRAEMKTVTPKIKPANPPGVN